MQPLRSEIPLCIGEKSVYVVLFMQRKRMSWPSQYISQAQTSIVIEPTLSKVELTCAFWTTVANPATQRFCIFYLVE